MCGISGFFTRSALPNQKISRIREGIRERGSDNFGEISGFDPNSHSSGLYHARLSIVDIGASSDQPFVKMGKPEKLVYNGEVYNFRELREELRVSFGVTFETDGDT